MQLTKEEILEAQKLAAEEIRKEKIEQKKNEYKEWLRRPLWHRIFPYIITIKITRRPNA